VLANLHGGLWRSELAACAGNSTSVSSIVSSWSCSASVRVIALVTGAASSTPRISRCIMNRAIFLFYRERLARGLAAGVCPSGARWDCRSQRVAGPDRARDAHISLNVDSLFISRIGQSFFCGWLGVLVLFAAHELRNPGRFWRRRPLRIALSRG